jgi:broad specificity polyphosphatase/5'/3'-nucleotidase SurE
LANDPPRLQLERNRAAINVNMPPCLLRAATGMKVTRQRAMYAPQQPRIPVRLQQQLRAMEKEKEKK